MNDFNPEDGQLERELAAVFNKYSAENVSNTPDFVLSRVALDAVKTFNEAVHMRSDFIAGVPQSLKKYEKEFIIAVEDELEPVEVGIYSPVRAEILRVLQIAVGAQAIAEQEVLGLLEILADNLQPRDEYHTMDEIYDYRKVYNAHAIIGWQKLGYRVIKSKRHFDGELCFGGEYFIVTAQLPTGQISNHYKLEDWHLFKCPEVDRASEWDGHNPAIAYNRLYNALTR